MDKEKDVVCLLCLFTVIFIYIINLRLLIKGIKLNLNVFIFIMILNTVKRRSLKL